MNANSQAIISSLQTNAMIVDDHGNGTRERAANLVAIFTSRRGVEYVVQLFEVGQTSYFSVNPLYLDQNDGRVHLSTCSVGPAIDLRTVDSCAQAISEYNSWARENEINCGIFDEVVSI